MTKGSTPLRVLFVEDAFDQALLVKSFLSSAGKYDVTHSQDGDSAAALLRDKEWDLFVTDLNLPGTDGFALIRICCEVHPQVPIMATTGYTGPHYQEEAFRSGAHDLMTKPLEKQEFLDRLEKLLGQKGGAAPVGVPSGGSILAIGGLVGDAEMGCGGSLLQWVAKGKTVYVVPTCGDELEHTPEGLRGARAAAAVLGVQTVIDKDAMNDMTRRFALAEKMVREYKPEVVYAPAPSDDHPARREAFRIAKAASADVPSVFGYQTATTGMDFRPERYVDVSKQLKVKMEALAAYQNKGAGRLELRPRMAQAYALYWGRREEFKLVEAFEILKGS